MYGTILKLGMKAAPHALKLGATTAALGGAGYGVGVGTAGIVNQFAPEFIKDLYKGTIVGDDDGVFKGKGALAAILKPVVGEQELEAAAQLKDVKKQVLSPSGYSVEDLGLNSSSTRFDANTALNRIKRKEAEAEKKQARIDQLRPLEMQYAETAAARADALLMNANSLAFQREQLAQQDRQYNRDIDRQTELEKERAFLALMGAGLSGIEAAFV